VALAVDDPLMRAEVDRDDPREQGREDRQDQAEGQGVEVGPDLATVASRTPEDILTHVLDPNRETSPEFVEYTVAVDDGRVVTGLVAAETPSSVTLRGREGVEQTILRRNIAEIAGTGKSLMPEGFEKTISPAEMADLIAFILTLQE